MIGFILLPLAALAAYALGGLDYLRGLLLSPAPPTESVANPYTPPFTGGQCTGNPNRGYMVFITRFYNPNTMEEYVNPNPVPYGNGMFQVPVGKRVLSVTIQDTGFFQSWLVSWDGGSATLNAFGGSNTSGDIPITDFDVKIVYYDYSLSSEVLDSCGNLPNPNPAPSIGEDGIADSGSPNLDDDPIVVTGSPIVPLPNFYTALLAAIAAAKAAIDALNAIKSIADAIKAIGDILDAIKDVLDGIRKDRDDGNKQISRHSFGSISRDGYLRLYPEVSLSEKKAVYLDLIFLSIPVGYGKYFGNKSPNYYRFKSLGHIAFTSPTFGIMEVHPLEFSRISLQVPENATGFYYHIGLEGSIVANCSAYYRESVG